MPENQNGVLIFAYQNIGIAGIDAIHKSSIKIIKVFTHKDNPKHNIWWDSVMDYCTTQDISCSYIEDTDYDSIYNSYFNRNILGIFSFHSRRILPNKILSLGKFEILYHHV